MHLLRISKKIDMIKTEFLNMSIYLNIYLNLFFLFTDFLEKKKSVLLTFIPNVSIGRGLA